MLEKKISLKKPSELRKEKKKDVGTPPTPSKTLSETFDLMLTYISYARC